MANILNSDKIESESRLINSILSRKNISANAGVSFFLGAGCSLSSGIPLAGSIIEILRKLVFIDSQALRIPIRRISGESMLSYIDRVDAHILKYDSEYTEFVKQEEAKFRKKILTDSKGFKQYQPNKVTKSNLQLYKDSHFWDNLYGYWFERYSRNPRERQGLVEELMAGAKPNGAYIMLAQLIKNGYIQNIFTTNFDDLVNDALLKFYDYKAKVYAHNEIASYIRFNSNVPNIIKLHGDYMFENIKNLSNETSGLDSNMKQKFSEALGEQDIVFLGYNGTDLSIMPLLQDLQKEKRFTIYWCGMDEKRLHWRTSQLITNGNSAYFIKIKSFDDFIFKLFNYAQEKIEYNVVKNAKGREEDMKAYFTPIFNMKFKRSHKICSEIMSEPATVKVGEEVLEKIRTGSLKDAELARYYRLLHDFNQDTPWVVNNYAVLLIRQQSYAEAHSLLKEALKLQPNYSIAHYNMGVLLMDMDKLGDAASSFERAIKFDPSLAEAYNNLAVNLISQREYEKAFKQLEKAISLSRQGKFLVNMGVLQKNMKQYDSAVDFYDEAISKKEDVVRAMYNKANLLRITKDYGEAQKICLNAIKVEPDNELIYATLAEVYGDQNKTVQFYKYLQEALKRNYRIERHLNDNPYKKFKEKPKFKELLNVYSLPAK